ncbi:MULTISPECIES: class F sortase [unclassified Streptomyces]|uniref:class F sortase n=1 Tax=unclassified Streptomyces TaxID=2593676 RepID=UPI001F0379ED|nr:MULTISPECIES: class F sortase [unclassified Streptomyces]MCH0563765.1 class F sortase [Streptomyces sp. MUM 2J]MCH0570050.1 class F sortase [Streptomyces sp. MUM 136J]
MPDSERHVGAGRLLTGLAWAVLLLGLWMWGSEVTGAWSGTAARAAGDVAAVGRPGDIELPPPAQPLQAALPQRIDIPVLGVQAPVVARGLDGDGAIDPPPFDQAAVVGWYAGGARPGAAGTALMVGHVDTESRPAVFYKLSTLVPGRTVRVVRDDGKVAEFTVDAVDVVPRDHFDAHRAYGTRRAGRAELRLITCGGTFDRTGQAYTANVIVSAYLTGASG